MKKIVYVTSLVLAMALSIMACKEEETPEPVVEGIPKVSEFTPKAGPAGTVVTITGEDFSATSEANLVLFGTELATVLEASSTQLVVEVPEIPDDEPTSFNIRVTVDNKFGTSTEPYNVTTSITLNEIALTLFPQEVDTLVITNIDEFINPKVTFVSDNEESITVNEEGHLTILSAGEATVTASIGEFKTSCDILVLPGFLATGSKDNGDDTSVAMFWDNKAASELEGNGINSIGSAMVKTENDTLIVGADRFDTEVAAIWTNGEAEALPSDEMSAFATSIMMDGTDQLVAGMQVNEESILEAVLWTNGFQEVIGDGLTEENVYDITKRGDDVVLGGYKYNEETEHFVATLWINGEAQSLSNGSSNAEVNAVANNGEEVLAVGYEGLNATLWRNDEEETLPFGEPASAEGILVVGNDEYIVGHSATGSAFLLINGEENLLSQNSAKAYTIDVKDGNILVGGQEAEVATVWWINGEGELRTISLNGTKDCVQSLIAK